MSQWFESPSADCVSLVMARHVSAADAGIVAVATLNDVDAVVKIARRIEAISPDGDEMMSFGPKAEHVSLTFSNAKGSRQKFDLYQRRIKTPSTGFHSLESAGEAALCADLEALLLPAFGKKMLKVRGLVLPFKDFSIRYQGEHATDGAPATVSFVRETFVVTDKQSEQELSVVWGQLPPSPLAFRAGGSKATLLTYQTKTHERLHPEYFLLMK